MSFARVVQDIDCKSGHTSGLHSRRSLLQRLPTQRSHPSGSMGPQGPLRALIWHLTVHPPSHTALSCVPLPPASALSAKACCPHQATDPSSPAAVQHMHPSAYMCSLAHNCTAGLHAPKHCSAEPHRKGQAWPLPASHLVLLLCKERLQLVQGRLRDVLQAAQPARWRLAACACPLEAALRC